ncbi:hypothetical protein G7Y79_00059g091750 [Physcia stellaris]|nr:hypothetical protein G7Y79_00059g091750 [Physcia stellaris]
MADQLAKLDPAQLSKMPSVAPPPGATVDFNGQNPLETTSIAVTSVFMGLAFFFVAIRACTKMKEYNRRSWDDVTCAIGLLGTLAYWIVFLLQVVNEGFGRHYWNVPLIITLSDAFFKLAFLSDWMCNVAYLFVKITFFIIYWNIFKPFHWLRIGIIGGAVTFAIVYVAFIVASLVGAAPRPGRTWFQAYTEPNDGIGKKLSLPLAAWALVSDIYIIILPICGVLQLQLSRQKKFGLSMCFMAGIG